MNRFSILCAVLAAGAICACNVPVEETPLDADFDISATTASIGQKIVFIDKSQGNPSGWNWEFIGGTPESSILSSPEISYAIPGTYSVKLTVKRGDKSSEITKTDLITIEYPDTIVSDFSADKTTVVQNETVRFTDNSTGAPNQWKWEFIANGTTVKTSTEQNPELSFEDDGIYTVRLTATNPRTTDTETKENYLTVIDQYAVVAGFKADSRRTVAGGSIKFQDTSIGNAESWAWEFEGGSPATSNDRNPTVNYAAAGRYKVKLTVSNTGNSDEIEKDEFIAVIPGEDMILYYPLDGNALDAGPNELDPTVLEIGSGTLTYRENSRGTVTGAFMVDKKDAEATGGILTVPDNSLVNGAASYTVSFWARTINSTSDQFLFHQGRGTRNFPNHGSGMYMQTAFRYQAASTTFRFYLEYSGLAGNWTDFKNEAFYKDGQWHHYACVTVIEANNTQSSYLYMDGAQVASAKNKALKAVANKPYTIGAAHVFSTGTPPDAPNADSGYPPFNSYADGAEINGYLGYKQHFNGELSDYVHYKRALSADEVAELYNLTKEPDTVR